jgi:hypothetical protein
MTHLWRSFGGSISQPSDIYQDTLINDPTMRKPEKLDVAITTWRKTSDVVSTRDGPSPRARRKGLARQQRENFSVEGLRDLFTWKPRGINNTGQGKWRQGDSAGIALEFGTM